MQPYTTVEVLLISQAELNSKHHCTGMQLKVKMFALEWKCRKVTEFQEQ